MMIYSKPVLPTFLSSATRSYAVFGPNARRKGMGASFKDIDAGLVPGAFVPHFVLHFVLHFVDFDRDLNARTDNV
jgi:hypothetical protein